MGVEDHRIERIPAIKELGISEIILHIKLKDNADKYIQDLQINFDATNSKFKQTCIEKFQDEYVDKLEMSLKDISFCVPEMIVSLLKLLEEHISQSNDDSFKEKLALFSKPQRVQKPQVAVNKSKLFQGFPSQRGPLPGVDMPYRRESSLDGSRARRNS